MELTYEVRELVEHYRQEDSVFLRYELENDPNHQVLVDLDNNQRAYLVPTSMLTETADLTTTNLMIRGVIKRFDRLAWEDENNAPDCVQARIGDAMLHLGVLVLDSTIELAVIRGNDVLYKVLFGPSTPQRVLNQAVGAAIRIAKEEVAPIDA